MCRPLHPVLGFEIEIPFEWRRLVAVIVWSMWVDCPTLPAGERSMNFTTKSIVIVIIINIISAQSASYEIEYNIGYDTKYI